MLPTSQGRTQELGLSASSGRTRISALPPSHSTNSSSALVEYMSPKSNQEDEDLEVKRYRIKETSISQFIQRLLSNPQNTNLILNPQYREITQNPVFTSKSQLTSPETMQILCIINYSSPLSRRKTQGTTRYIRSSENGTTTRNLRKAAAQEVVDKVRQHNGLLVDQVYYPKFLSLVSAYCNNLVELEVKNTWLSVDHMNQMLMIRKVDPTLDMEADEGDNYTHIPVRNRVG